MDEEWLRVLSLSTIKFICKQGLRLYSVLYKTENLCKSAMHPHPPIFIDIVYKSIKDFSI